mgnify:CR=1 FL=1
MSAEPRPPEIATNIVPDAPDGRDLSWESADERFEEDSTLRGALLEWRRTSVALDELWPSDRRRTRSAARVPRSAKSLGRRSSGRYSDPLAGLAQLVERAAVNR